MWCFLNFNSVQNRQILVPDIIISEVLYGLGGEEGYTVKYTLCLKEFPRAKPEGTPEGKGLYLIVYPELSPNTDIAELQIKPKAKSNQTKNLERLYNCLVSCLFVTLRTVLMILWPLKMLTNN